MHRALTMILSLARLTVLVLLAGCTAPPAGDRDAPAPAPGDDVDRGVLALVVRGDTTVVDEYLRSASGLEGVVRPRVTGAKFGWARYRVELSPSGEALRAHLALGRVGTSPDSAPVDSLTTTFGPDGIVEEWPNRPPTRAPAAAGAVPLFGPSIAMLQEVVRRAHRLTGGHGEVEVPLYPLLAGGEIQRVRATWPAPDTVEILWGSSPAARYAVDVRGRILWGRTSDGGFVTVRVR